MSKGWLTIGVILGIAVGFVSGAVWIGRKAAFVSWHQSTGAASIQANVAVTTLRSIRTGDTNKATECLEDQLDQAVIHLADLYAGCPRPQDANALVSALLRAKEYRASHPRKSESSTMDKAIAHAFILADTARKILPRVAERGYDPLDTNAMTLQP